MEDLVAINRLGILVWDVREGNYLQGRLVDFSQARIVPHYELTVGLANYQLRSLDTDAYHDFGQFGNYVVDAWNWEHKARIWDHFYPTGDIFNICASTSASLNDPQALLRRLDMTGNLSSEKISYERAIKTSRRAPIKPAKRRSKKSRRYGVAKCTKVRQQYGFVLDQRV